MPNTSKKQMQVNDNSARTQTSKNQGPTQAPRVQKHQGNLNVPRVFRTTRGISVQGHQAPRVQASTRGISMCHACSEASWESHCATRVPNHQGPNQVPGVQINTKPSAGDHIKHQGPRDQIKYQGSKASTREITMCQPCSEPPGNHNVSTAQRQLGLGRAS